MKKPTQEIERMRAWAVDGYFWSGKGPTIDGKAILAYLDSIKEWPADLTRERLEELADSEYPMMAARWDALRRLAELAPKREKRKVALYEYQGHSDGATTYGAIVGFTFDGPMPGGFPWRKVGEAEIDA